VGAGAVVTRSVKDFELVRGNPARHGGWVSLDGEKLTFDPDGKGIDKQGNVYRLTDGRVEMPGENNAAK
jgi:UDP-2-acetamido-3-amino-2,3-dideoxy-glucuronate N-acetyltransferase